MASKNHQVLLNLPAEERIKEIKELLKELEKNLIQEQKKETKKEKNSSVKKEMQNEVQKEIQKEIALLKNILHEAEQELSERGKRKERIPIEEIAKEEMDGLSQEGKEMVKALKNIREKKNGAQEKDSERDTGKEQKKRYEILEETIAKERKTFSQETAGAQTTGMQYGFSPE